MREMEKKKEKREKTKSLCVRIYVVETGLEKMASFYTLDVLLSLTFRERKKKSFCSYLKELNIQAK